MNIYALGMVMLCVVACVAVLLGGGPGRLPPWPTPRERAALERVASGRQTGRAKKRAQTAPSASPAPPSPGKEKAVSDEQLAAEIRAAVLALRAPLEEAHRRKLEVRFSGDDGYGASTSEFRDGKVTVWVSKETRL